MKFWNQCLEPLNQLPHPVTSLVQSLSEILLWQWKGDRRRSRSCAWLTPGHCMVWTEPLAGHYTLIQLHTATATHCYSSTLLQLHTATHCYSSTLLHTEHWFTVNTDSHSTLILIPTIHTPHSKPFIIDSNICMALDELWNYNCPPSIALSFFRLIL